MDKLILALDVDDETVAEAWVRRFRDRLWLYKVGSQLFTRCGPALVRTLQREGAEIFLDLKWHDIPQTVGQAVRAAADLGVRMATIHACGGSAMIQAAVEACEGSQLNLLGVTVLTSLDGEGLKEVGISAQKDATEEEVVREQVVRLAKLAVAAGLRGLVCSPHEITLIRQQVAVPAGEFLTIVTPGVRPVGSDLGDQRRVMSPSEAFRLGANHLVIGRPILKAKDPEAMVARILEA